MREEIQKTQISKSSSKYRNIAVLAIFVVVTILIRLFWYPVLQEKTSQLEKHNDDIRRITISNMKLEIPRSYLIGSSASKDDDDDTALLLGFTYRKPNAKSDEAGAKISLWFQDLNEYFSRSGDTKESYVQYFYWEDLLDIEQGVDKYKIKYQNFYEKLGRNHYIFENFGKKLENMDEIVKSISTDDKLSDEAVIKLKAAMTKLQIKAEKRFNEELAPQISHVYTNDYPEKPKDFVVCDSEALCNSIFFYIKLMIIFKKI